MNSNPKNQNIGQDNENARKRGNVAAREFEQVVQTFNKVLQYKEKIRLSLDEQISGLRFRHKENRNQLNTLDRNLDIYQQNMEKIAVNLENLEQEEKEIKDNYEQLLQGSAADKLMPDPVHSLPLDESGDTGLSREKLIQRRRDFLDNLDNTFRQMDAELYSIDGLKKEMMKARSEIFRKKEEALLKRDVLKDNERQLDGEINQVETELEISVKEEQVLILEFSKLVENVESRIEISEEIDQVLFSFLNASESRPEPGWISDDDPGQ